MGVKYAYNNHTNMSMISTINNPNERPCSFSHLPQGGDTQTSQDGHVFHFQSSRQIVGNLANIHANLTQYCFVFSVTYCAVINPNLSVYLNYF